MGHHQVLEICDSLNSHVLLTEHSNCERGYLKDIFTPLLEKTLEKVTLEAIYVKYAESDYQDPLSIV